MIHLYLYIVSKYSKGALGDCVEIKMKSTGPTNTYRAAFTTSLMNNSFETELTQNVFFGQL